MFRLNCIRHYFQTMNVLDCQSNIGKKNFHKASFARWATMVLQTG